MVAGTPTASADSSVCNYGHLISDVAKAPGPTSGFTGFTSPYTINGNGTNIPRGGVQLLLCQFQ